MVLENFDEARIGTHEKMQAIFSLASGALKDVTIYSPLGDEVFLDAAKMKAASITVVVSDPDKLPLSIAARLDSTLQVVPVTQGVSGIERKNGR